VSLWNHTLAKRICEGADEAPRRDIGLLTNVKPQKEASSEQMLQKKGVTAIDCILEDVMSRHEGKCKHCVSI